MDKNKMVCIIVLIVMIITITTIYYFENGFEKDSLIIFLENLTTEVIGILITVLIVDLLLNKRSRDNQNKIKLLMMRQLKAPLTQSFSLFFEMYNGLDAASINSFEDIKSQEFLFKMQNFDFSKTTTFLDITWKQHFFEELNVSERKLSNFLQRNIIYLEPSLADVITNIVESPLNELKNLKTTSANIFSSNNLMELFKDYIKNYVNLLNYYNRNCSDNITLNFLKSQYTIKKSA